MEIRQWSQTSQAFKTISSQTETRNQTSNKHQLTRQKWITHDYLNYMSLQQMQELLKKLIDIRTCELAKRRYERVLKLEKKINEIKRWITGVKEKKIERVNEEQHFEVYKEHENQVKKFRQCWESIFAKFDKKQLELKQKLRNQQQQQIQIVTTNIRKRIDSLDHRLTRNHQLYQLEKMQHKLKQKGNYDQLVKMNIKQKIQGVKLRLIEERNSSISKIYRIEEEKLRRKYDQKHNSLLQRLSECKNYELRIFRKYEKMLKQKFKNNLCKLEHEQCLRKKRCCSTMK